MIPTSSSRDVLKSVFLSQRSPRHLSPHHLLIAMFFFPSFSFWNVFHTLVGIHTIILTHSPNYLLNLMFNTPSSQCNTPHLFLLHCSPHHSINAMFSAPFYRSVLYIMILRECFPHYLLVGMLSTSYYKILHTIFSMQCSQHTLLPRILQMNLLLQSSPHHSRPLFSKPCAQCSQYRFLASMVPTHRLLYTMCSTSFFYLTVLHTIFSFQCFPNYCLSAVFSAPSSD